MAGPIEKLYKVYSYVNSYKELGDVRFEWVYHLRNQPVAPYNEMIVEYADPHEEEKQLARDRVDEMFTDDEVEAGGSPHQAP